MDKKLNSVISSITKIKHLFDKTMIEMYVFVEKTQKKGELVNLTLIGTYWESTFMQKKK